MTDRTPPETLVDQYDLLLVDLDGVVYVGEHPVPGAARALAELRRREISVCFVTNNASRSAQDVAELLSRVDVPAGVEEVMTAAQATAQLLGQRLPPGSPVLVVGTRALCHEVATYGLSPVSSAEAKPVAVVQGYGPEVGWRDLAEAAVAINEGVFWVATNTDRTLPSPRGQLPGNGALVAALTVTTGREPDLVVGKPQPELFTAAARRFGAERPLVVGDRLDTDIEGAVRAGYDSALVLTGVTRPVEALAAGPESQPRYLAATLTDLVVAEYPTVTVQDSDTRCRDWTVSVVGGQACLNGDGEPIDALRAIAAAVRAHPALPRTRIGAASPTAERVLRQLGLSVPARLEQRP